MARATGHIPRYPPGFIVLRIFQFIFNLGILGNIAYATYIAPFSGDILMLATSGLTFIVTLWLICAHSCTPNLYNYWAVLAFEILLFICWVASVGLLGSQTAYYWSAGSAYCGLYSCSYGSLAGADLVYGTILAAACAGGALEVLFFKISLIIHSVVIYRHRRQGGGIYVKASGSEDGPYQVQMKSHSKADFEAVPQQGVPFTQDTAYNPHGMYNPPPPEKTFQPQTQQTTPQQVPPVQVTSPQVQPLFHQPPPPLAP
ncbi:Fc.00g017070.m01.CDS01 [Cosmosporella sp. VM-42]